MVKRPTYGRWQIIKSLDEGGQAHLFLVEDAQGELGGPHVLKRLRNIDRLDRFKREIEVTARLNHPNILRIIDFSVDSRPAYYVAEWCELGSLVDVGAETFRGDIIETVAVLLPIVDALQAAATLMPPVVHRDVKPENILRRRDGTPVLADFGICHVADGRYLTLSDRGMGSTNYIAPEMQAGQHALLTHGVDVYALGKVMYWMLSGGHIFAREGHRESGCHLTERLGEQRWEHVHELLDNMIVADFRRRHPLALLPTILRGVEDMVNGDFVPLRPSVGLRCRWCGKGTYERHDTLKQTGHIEMRALRCSHCGHLEYFEVKGVENSGWFDR